MVTGAVAELIVGVKRDDSFGLALVVGSGGILVELTRDSTALLLPTNRQAVVEALASLKAAKLLSGYRTGRKGDFEAAVDAVMAVAGYAEAHRDRLVELDVNPLLVLPAGAGVVAVDALIRMAD
jgi:acyl-CoA synthetase (NDP forming)